MCILPLSRGLRWVSPRLRFSKTRSWVTWLHGIDASDCVRACGRLRRSGRFHGCPYAVSSLLKCNNACRFKSLGFAGWVLCQKGVSEYDNRNPICILPVSIPLCGKAHLNFLIKPLRNVLWRISFDAHRKAQSGRSLERP